MRTYAASAYEEQPADDVRGVDAVKVMTVHQAKGLEWPAVFVVGAARDQFPLPVERWAGRRADGGGRWMGVPRQMFDAARYDGSLEEEKRLFYVAMTRARDVLVLTGATGADGRGRSEFAAAIDGYLERVGALKDAMDAKGVALKSRERGEEMQTFAAGDLIRYSRCPHMYLLGKVWGYQPELDEAIGFGNGLHYCLKRAAEAVQAGNDPVDAVRDAVDACFFVPFADERTAETFRDSARGMLERFAGAHGGDLAKIEESEYLIEYPLENATVTGRVDVILREGGVREVREYKTSDEVVTPEELAAQIRMYALGLDRVGKPIGRASAAYLKEGRGDRGGGTPEELEGARGLVSRCVRGIVGGVFGPTLQKVPGDELGDRRFKEGSCWRCDQRSICRWFYMQR
jgi:DNA helicase-2/ATP-dependent DNA helicase PcrA